MRIPYPKTAYEIEVVVEVSGDTPEPGAPASDGALVTTLADKIVEYRFEIDLPEERVKAFVEDLLRKGIASCALPGKRGTEHFVLADAGDTLSPTQARTLFEDFMAETAERQRKWDS